MYDIHFTYSHLLQVVDHRQGGHSTFFGLLNTFVHIVMYFYYFLTALGPQVQKYLWWKKYLTSFQMVQFVAIMLHAFQLLFIDCNYPRVFAWWIGSHAVLFFFLFKDFYQKSYKNARNASRAKREKIESSQALHQNGLSKQNGAVNGVLKANGVVKVASDYYVNGVDGSTELHQRLKQQ
ncbi:hypothetical protein HUJ05_008490 [Dendroctonus ponderosae]|nr:hypothetical protein HUJ05_008490 [Dendroctonus ponderosae]